MEKYKYDESNGLWYELQGDYYLPCLKLPEEKYQPIGICGQRHHEYLRRNKRMTLSILQISGKLNDYLANIDQQAKEIFERLPRQPPLTCHALSAIMQIWRESRSSFCFLYRTLDFTHNLKKSPTRMWILPIMRT